jgi:hypothetical protein
VVLISDGHGGDEGPRLRDPALGLSAFRSRLYGCFGRRADALINGAAGWVSVLDGELYAIAALTVHNGRITTMDILLDPARLARLDPTDFLTDFDSRL